MQLNHVKVEVADNFYAVHAYDADDTMIATFVMWEDTGTIWLAADYSDGYIVVGISPELGEVYRDATLPPDVLADRAELVLELFDPAHPAGEEKKRSWAECAWKTVAAGAACAVANAIGCVGGSIKVGCACIPKLIKEFEGYECPWGL